MIHNHLDKKYLFDFIFKNTKEYSNKHNIALDAGFQKWFMNMYFQHPKDIIISDGSRDGKIDSFCKVLDIDTLSYKILNSKFTKTYDKLAPSQFYDEIIAFNALFVNKQARAKFLEKYIKKDMKNFYGILFDQYDKDNAELIFITNHKKNYNQLIRIENLQIKVFHLEDILQLVVDDIEGAMPLTNPLFLTGITNVLSANNEDTIVPTSIVFAKVIDFLNYMKEDPFDLLFSRNIRLNLGNTDPNKSIKNTFRDNPKEFVFSNNGITLLCEEINHKTGSHELLLKNPRVVNGSQTLHSIRHVSNPSREARVMVRIIEIPPFRSDNFTEAQRQRKDIINKISIRSNLQNPITKWNLAANDDYQLELKRYFRQRGFFYETRKKEWEFRKTELKNVGISRGPYLPKLIQLIASYNCNKKYLGPALAKQSINDLFVEDKAYAKISKTDASVVYQIYLLNKIIEMTYSELGNFQYINNIKSHAWLTVFAIYCKTLEQHKICWGSKEFTEFLELRYRDYDILLWISLTKTIVKDLIIPCFKKEQKRYKSMEGAILSYNTYFKNQSFVNALLNKSQTAQIRKLTKKLLKKI